MEEISSSTFDDFAKWYLDREMYEKQGSPTPSAPEGRLLAMREHHSGKMQPWFTTRAQWRIYRLTSHEELKALMILASDWTRREHLIPEGKPRLLGNVSLGPEYFTPDRDPRNYYHRLQSGQIFLNGPNRFVLRTLNGSEREELAPFRVRTARFYLHDGLGRALAYITLIQRGVLSFSPVEAFVAEEMVG